MSHSTAEAEATAPPSEKAAGSGRLRRALLFGAGTVLLLLYLRGLDYSTLLANLEAFPLGLALVIIALNLLPGGFKYFRWRRLLAERDLGVEGWKGYLAVNASYFLGLVTPGTAGEMSRAWVSESEEAGRATAVVAFEKLTDLVVLLLLVVGSAAVQFTQGLRSWGVVAAALLAVASLYFVFLRFDGLLTTPFKYLLRRAVTDQRRRSLREAYWEFYELLEDRKLVVYSTAVSAALWLVTLVQMHLIFTGLGWELPLKTTALALFLPYLVGVVSLIPLGLGVFELAMSNVTEVGLVGSVAGGTAAGPLFFRFLVTVPLVVGGYACHLWLTMIRSRGEP